MTNVGGFRGVITMGLGPITSRMAQMMRPQVQQRTLMPEPAGGPPRGPMPIGNSSGGRTYTPNPFQQAQPNMGFGGGPPPMNPTMGGPQMQNSMMPTQNFSAAPSEDPAFGRQQALIRAVRGRMMG